MRSAGNFHPEWGYLAPTPSFIRTVRTALMAAAVGGVAGAGVVLSLMDRPADVEVAAQTVAAPVEAAARAPLQSAQLSVEAIVQNRRQPVPAVGEPPTQAALQSPQATTSLADGTGATDSAAAKAVAETSASPTDAQATTGLAQAQKKAAAKKRRAAPSYAFRGGFPGDSYGAAGGLYMNGSHAYRADRWSRYQDREEAHDDR